MQEFSRERQPLHCDVIIGKQYVLIKLDRVSCTNYFMSIHNLQCRVKLNKIGKRDKKKSLKKHCIQDSGTEINFVRVILYVCRRGLYVIYIVT